MHQNVHFLDTWLNLCLYYIQIYGGKSKTYQSKALRLVCFYWKDVACVKRPCALLCSLLRGQVSFIHPRYNSYNSISLSTHICPSSTKNILIQFKFGKINHHINQQMLVTFLSPNRDDRRRKREKERGRWRRGDGATFLRSNKKQTSPNFLLKGN